MNRDFSSCNADDPSVGETSKSPHRLSKSEINERRKHVFKLRTVDGLSHREIGNRLNVSSKTVQRDLEALHDENDDLFDDISECFQ